MKKTNAIILLLILSLVLVSFNDTNSNKHDEMITRHDKNDTEFIKLAERFEKYMCLLNLPDCEGTLIADQWVVSAAHCAISITEKFNNGRKHFVIINDAEIEVDKVIMSKEWESLLQEEDASALNNMRSFNDIALLHLKTKPEGAMKAKLYVDEDEVDKLVYMVGRGNKGNGLVGIKGNDGKQRAATNRIETATKKWLTWTFDHPDTKTKYLIEYEGISGPGDSGGPAFILKNDTVYLAGISSWQDRKGGPEGLYGVVENYTRVSQFKQWIHDEMAGTNASSKAMSRVEVKPNATFYKPKAIDVNPSILKQYVGVYETATNTSIKVYTKENGTKFFILVAKKEEYEFIPTAKNEFSSKKHEGFNLEFKNIKNGVSKELVLILSDGRRREAIRK